MPNFANRLKVLRKQHKLTQEQLAEKTNIPFASIRRLESSMTSIPCRDRLILLSNFFNVSIDYLVSGDINTRKHENTQDKNIAIIKELVDKYDIDLSVAKNKQLLEKMIKLLYEEE